VIFTKAQALFAFSPNRTANAGFSVITVALVGHAMAAVTREWPSPADKFLRAVRFRFGPNGDIRLLRARVRYPMLT